MGEEGLTGDEVFQALSQEPPGVHRRRAMDELERAEDAAGMSHGPRVSWRMSTEDFRLSMAISPRARRDEDNVELRELRIHRLTDTTKAVARAAIKTGRVSMHCEACKRWYPVKDFPLEWECPRCGRAYRQELSVYEEVDPND